MIYLKYHLLGIQTPTLRSCTWSRCGQTSVFLPYIFCLFLKYVFFTVLVSGNYCKITTIHISQVSSLFIANNFPDVISRSFIFFFSYLEITVSCASNSPIRALFCLCRFFWNCFIFIHRFKNTLTLVLKLLPVYGSASVGSLRVINSCSKSILT